MSTGNQPILAELCGDALALTRLLACDETIANAETMALLALMYFNGARLESRLDEAGNLVPLDRQDRTLWDRDLIHAGFQWLARSARNDSDGRTRYQLEAAIAARHCSAKSFADTDWASICRLYDHARAGSAEPARRYLAEALARARTEHERALIALQVERATGDPPA